MKQEESRLSEQVSQFLKLQYPNLIYRFDVSDLKLSMPQAMRNKKLQMKDRGYPDLFLAFPSKGFHGLYIELKKDRSEVYKKDGTFKRKWNRKTQSCHVAEQNTILKRLNDLGYKAVYGFGFIDSITKIKEYLN